MRRAAETVALLMAGFLSDRFMAGADNRLIGTFAVICGLAAIGWAMWSIPATKRKGLSRRSRMLVALGFFFVGGLVSSGMWWFASREDAPAESTALISLHDSPPQTSVTVNEAREIPVVPSPAPQHAPVAPRQTGVSAEHLIDALEERLAQRLNSTSSSFVYPPYSLGGSLQREDFFDFMSGFDRPWIPVRNAVDVLVDWTRFAGVELVADVKVVLNFGSLRVGIWDVDNRVLVAQRDVIEKTPEDGLRLAIPLPRAKVPRTYRLMVQATGFRASNFQVAGEIAFPILSFGPVDAGFTAPDEKTLIGTMPSGQIVDVDWTKISAPITSVVADLRLETKFEEFQQRGRHRVIVRDLTDDSTSVTGDWHETAWIGGIMASARPQIPALRYLRLPLPDAKGIHRYRLEVEVSRTRMNVSVSGSLLFRR